MTITLNTADLPDADIQAVIAMLGWKNATIETVRQISPAAIHLAAALRLIREERAEHEAFKRKVSDAMKVVQRQLSLERTLTGNPTIVVETVANDLGVFKFSDFIQTPVDPIEERARAIWEKAVTLGDNAAIAVIADAMRGEGK